VKSPAEVVEQKLTAAGELLLACEDPSLVAIGQRLTQLAERARHTLNVLKRRTLS
jgi:hypothetical protein